MGTDVVTKSGSRHYSCAPVGPGGRRAAEGNQRPRRRADVVAEQAAAQRREDERQARHDPVNVGPATPAAAAAAAALWRSAVSTILAGSQ